MSTNHRIASGHVLEVWLDSDLCEPCIVGTLGHDRGQVRFHYDKSWIDHPQAFSLDPDLSLGDYPYFPRPETGNFGAFLDSSPDRWGQMLMNRREAMASKDEGRGRRTLYAWDFLIGVQDLTRQGALRFRMQGSDEFLGNDKFAAPPVTSLRELESIAVELTSKKAQDLSVLRKWLAVLVAPGASLGGARPKANFTEQDGSLWIGKFPARDDDRDVGAWEYLTHTLALRAGIDVPPAKLIRLNGEHHTFCVRRFDRAGDKRKFYVSAMTQLRKDLSEGSSYLDLAQGLRQAGTMSVETELEQLFRRVVFNVAVGNRDDHLRNHGFLLDKSGLRLAPAFDVNPNFDKADHVLNIDDSDNRPNLLTVASTSEFYDLTPKEALTIIEEIVDVVSNWRIEAIQLGIHRNEIELAEVAFSAHASYRSQQHPVHK